MPATPKPLCRRTCVSCGTQAILHAYSAVHTALRTWQLWTSSLPYCQYCYMLGTWCAAQSLLMAPVLGRIICIALSRSTSCLCKRMEQLDRSLEQPCAGMCSVSLEQSSLLAALASDTTADAKQRRWGPSLVPLWPANPVLSAARSWAGAPGPTLGWHWALIIMQLGPQVALQLLPLSTPIAASQHSRCSTRGVQTSRE